MDVSFYHNVIVTASNTNQIYTWDYEFGKLLAILELEEGIEPTALSFMDGYNILLVAANDGKLYMIHFVTQD